MQSKLTKVAAARAAGVSHTTIWRAIKDGRLSAEQVDGEVRIDLSELTRVYPDADPERARVRGATRSQPARERAREPFDEPDALLALVDELRADKRRQAAELDRAATERGELLAMVREKDEALAAKDRLLEEQLQTVRLITDERRARRPWWRWWRRS